MQKISRNLVLQKLVEFGLLRPRYWICHFEFRKSGNSYVISIAKEPRMQSFIKISAKEKLVPQRVNT